MPQSPSSSTTADYHRVGQFIYGFQRLLMQLDQAGPGVRQGLAGRVAHLTQEQAVIVQSAGVVPDAQLDAALSELQAITAALKAAPAQ